MVYPLTSEQQSKVRFHLAYNLATPADDHARLFVAMNNVADTWTQTRLGDLIVACDDAYALTTLEAGTAATELATEISGDLSRTTALQARDPYNRRLRSYVNQTNFLSSTLGVRNYRDPEQSAQGFIEGSTLLQNIPVLEPFETTAELDVRDTANRDRDNHTGTQAIATIVGLQTALDLLNSFAWLGEWDIATAYFVDDVVFHNGSSWVATAGNTGSEPPSANWDLFAQKGDAGIQGIQGEQGPAGESIVGAKGDQGDPGIQGIQGIQGIAGDIGSAGVGITSEAYNYSTGVLTLNFSDSSSYSTGDLRGEQGIQGIQGIQGDSIYEVAIAEGFIGTQAQWLGYVISEIGGDVNDATALETLIVSLSDNVTPVGTGTSIELITLRYNFTVTGVWFETPFQAPTGSSAIVRVLADAANIFTSVDALTIPADSTSVGPLVPNTSFLATGTVLRFDIQQVGATDTGRGYRVTLQGTRS